MDQYSEGDEFNESRFGKRLAKKLFLISLATSIFLFAITKVRVKKVLLTKLDYVIKPPLGIFPTKLWLEAREKEINAAVQRYSEAEMEVPISWIAESYDLKNRLKEMEGLYFNRESKPMKEKDIICPPMKVIINGVKYTPKSK